ncbi:MAG: PKD domain protein [Bacteroidetes bacterium ADurb.Bin408]|nr:MAG: PKD domain protein [Bacteroidetes bacterium ADurb.Bin408]
MNVTPPQNTTYYLTVTDNCGTPPTNSHVQVQVYPMPNISFTADTTQGCEPLLVQFTNTTLPAPVSSQWDFGDPQSGVLNTSSSVNPFHLYTNAGTYNVSLTVQTAEGCTATYVNNNMIQVYPFPTASFYTNPTEGDMENPHITFINTSVGASSWFWWFGEPSTGSDNISSDENPEHTYMNTGVYNAMLVAISSYGCKDTTYRPVRIKEIFSMYIPNAFSPNSDGLNDLFIPVFSGVQTFNMFIFNRWGEMVYETDNSSQPWDGTVKNGTEVAMMDVYSYLILVKDINGKEHKYIGHITLLKSDNYNVY